MHWFLRAEVLLKEGRNVEASAAIADTQSVKTAGPAIESGYDGGKNILGRKRHILVDTLGLLLAVFVHDAHRSDQAGFQLLCFWVQGLFPRLRLIWVDSSYRGQKLAQWLQLSLWLALGCGQASG